MDLEKLKSAWDSYSSKNASLHQLDEGTIRELLARRTGSLVERIDRNIKIGFGVLFLILVLYVLDDFVIAPRLLNGSDIPFWILWLDALSILAIAGTFVYFAITYSRQKKQYFSSDDLRLRLVGIINTIDTYRKMFNLALALLLVVTGISFLTGLYMGLEMAALEKGRTLADLKPWQIARVLLIGAGVLLAIIGGFLWLFRWGFRRLYGNYLKKLKSTLQELDEIE